MKFLHKYAGYIFLCALIVLTLKVFIPQLDELKVSLSALKEADLKWIVLGTIVFFTGIPILALQFVALALKPLKFGLTYRVEMASLFVSKLLPSVVGSISLNAYYFVKQKHTPSQAATVIAMNSLTSGVAYLTLIIIGMSVSTLSLEGVAEAFSVPQNLWLFFGILLFGVLSLLHKSKALQKRLESLWNDTKKNIQFYKNRPTAPLLGLIYNFAGSSTSLFALYASAHSINVDLTFAGALLAYTFGNIAAALVPTPGGLGATEAGIYSGLVMVGIPGPEAIIITSIYRVITYWLPILPGYYFFWDLRKSVLSGFKIHKNYAS
jgi:uncharacterized protein (TIRG00374 family)